MVQRIKQINDVNFTWKYISLIFAVLAVFLFYNREIYVQELEADEKCAYLPTGQYSVTVTYDNVTAGSTYTLLAESAVTENNKQGEILAAGELPVGQGIMILSVNVAEDARSVVLRSQEGVESWYIQSVKLMCYDNFLLSLLFFLLAVGSLIYGSKFYKKEHNVIFLLFGVGILASIPLFNNYMIIGHDTDFHLARINGIYEGLKTGQFPVRVNPLQLEGYGYLSGILYPQLFFYIPAILKFFNISTMLGMKLLIFLVNMGTVFFTYYCVRGICRNNRVALLAAILYTLNPYRLINFYVRGAVGEGLAMAFLPLIILGTYEILWGKHKKWWLLLVGMTGVISSHVLSVEIYAALILIEMIIWFFSRERDQFINRMTAMCKATVGTILINMYFLGPLLRFSKENLRCFSLPNAPEELLLDFMKIFEPFFKWSGKAESLGIKDSMSMTLGAVVLAGMILFCSRMLINKERNHLTKVGKHCLLFGSLFLLVTLWMAPWKVLLNIKKIEGVLRTLQFPWRFLGISALFLSIVTAIAIVEWESIQKDTKWLGPVLLLAVFLGSGYFYGQVSQEANVIGKIETNGNNHTDDLYLSYDYSMPQDFYDVTMAHIMCNDLEHIAWMNERKSGLDVECREEEGVFWSNYKKSGLHISADVMVDDEKSGVTASFPLHFYPGYEVTIDGAPVEIWQYLSMVTCEIPQGTHHIEVRYAGLKIFVISDVITLCSLLGLAVWWVISLRIEKKRRRI